ncbi:carbohydrate ABC transporter permease [Salinibacterium sp. NK8237]|uniref:carbohydrate ABC transporter permease n=1 Tax=Salinibacterium sp. NK8237 TaxID=2792038 RepID=UPI0018CD1A86|nr:sugar ABC transporter permease [Salinibacterium sp. NK8237]MBH0130632.1 sugar ABC transporter permease [Salinibacterium sp. NK8237]
MTRVTTSKLTKPRGGSKALPPRGGVSRVALKGGWYAVGFLAPLGILYSVYFLFSFGILGVVSTQRVGLTFRNAVDVGFQNFVLVAGDPAFQGALMNTIAFAAFSVAVSLSLGFILAMMLASGIRMRRAFYTIFLLPSLIPMSLFATVFGRMLETRDGAINEFLRAIGLGFAAQDWLGDPTAAYVAVGVIITYAIGLPIMYYSTDVAQVQASVMESATLDGASVWQIYRIMLFPLLRTTHITVILSVVLGSFRAFDIIYFSTAGQPGGRTDITGTYIYKATLGLDRIGYAAAASILVLLVALAFSVVQIIVRRKAL